MKIHGTTKGGAISHKDFGVAFGGGGGVPLVELFDTTSCNFSYDLGFSQFNGYTYYGVKFTGTGATQTDFNKIVCSMSKKNAAGGFTGDMVMQIRDTDGTTVLVTGTTVNTSELDDIPTYKDITFTCETTTVTTGQYIGVQFPAGTNSTNCLFWSRSNSDNDCSNPSIDGSFGAGYLADIVGYGNEQ